MWKEGTRRRRRKMKANAGDGRGGERVRRGEAELVEERTTEEEDRKSVV